jgi:hypothetical protein
MIGRAAEKDAVSGACQLGECGHCHGNIDLRFGPGPAVPLLRCAHHCHRGQSPRERKT